MPDSLRKIQRLENRIDRWLPKEKKVTIKTIPYEIWQPQPKQLDMLKACGLEDALHGGPAKKPVAPMIGYGGAAFGGKTEGFVAVGLIACMMIPGCNVGIFRRTFKELEGSDGPIDRTYALYSQAGATYNKVEHRWSFPNGSNVRFCHCHIDSDKYAYQSQAFDIFLPDEATHFTWSIIDYLMTRNRPSKDSEIPEPFSVFSSNPGNVGHNWYKQIFDLGSRQQYGPHGTIKTTLNPNDKHERTFFIPAFLRDNQIGMAKDPGYEDRLDRREDKLSKALKDGDWDVFAGQAIAEWAATINGQPWHVIDPFVIPMHWPRWRAIDWGYAKPFCCLWFTKDIDTQRIYVYRELYMAGLSDQQQARLILEYTPEGEKILRTYADPSMWSKSRKKEDAPETSTADEYAAEGVPLVKANNARIDGKRKVHRLLGKQLDGGPGIQFFSTCSNTVEHIPALPSDKNNPEDVDTDAEDHTYDTLRYGLTDTKESKPPGKKKPQPHPLQRMKQI